MAAHVLEGTWEEITQHSEEFAGKTLSLTILPDPLGKDALERIPLTVNEEVRAALRKIMARQAGLRDEDHYRLAPSDAHP